jgi:hypothetical protein
VRNSWLHDEGLLRPYRPRIVRRTTWEDLLDARMTGSHTSGPTNYVTAAAGASPQFFSTTACATARETSRLGDRSFSCSARGELRQRSLASSGWWWWEPTYVLYREDIPLQSTLVLRPAEEAGIITDVCSAFGMPRLRQCGRPAP